LSVAATKSPSQNRSLAGAKFAALTYLDIQAELSAGSQTKAPTSLAMAGAKFSSSSKHPAGCIGIQAQCSSAVNRLQRMSALRNKKPQPERDLAGAKLMILAWIFRPKARPVSTPPH
jgi:hypothetical protein